MSYPNNTDCGDGGDNLSELQLEQDGGLTSGVQPNHENTHLLLAKEAIKQTTDHQTHLAL